MISINLSQSMTYVCYPNKKKQKLIKFSENNPNINLINEKNFMLFLSTKVQKTQHYI